MDFWIIVAIVCIAFGFGAAVGAAIGFYAAVKEGVSAPRYSRVGYPELTDCEIASVADNRFPQTILAPENDQRVEDFIAGASYARSRVGRPE